MAKGKNKPKLTNKQIEYHLNNLYKAITQESNTLSTTMQVLTDFIEFSKKTDDFQEFIQKKYKDLEDKKEKPKIITK